MKFRWKIMNTMIIGSVAMTEPAISTVELMAAAESEPAPSR